MVVGRAARAGGARFGVGLTGAARVVGAPGAARSVGAARVGTRARGAAAVARAPVAGAARPARGRWAAAATAHCSLLPVSEASAAPPGSVRPDVVGSAPGADGV